MVAEPMSSSNPPLVVLKNGLTVPVDAVRLLWQLEDRGLYVRRDGDGLAVGPRQHLTDADRAAIRRHRDHYWPWPPTASTFNENAVTTCYATL
jgi:hypothetical protein